jgi:hypothetical protein
MKKQGPPPWVMYMVGMRSAAVSLTGSLMVSPLLEASINVAPFS